MLITEKFRSCVSTLRRTKIWCTKSTVPSSKLRRGLKSWILFSPCFCQSALQAARCCGHRASASLLHKQLYIVVTVLLPVCSAGSTMLWSPCICQSAPQAALYCGHCASVSLLRKQLYVVVTVLLPVCSTSSSILW